jgi:molybdenum-dependent DNA-binding transcriptional regulator ModE
MGQLENHLLLASKEFLNASVDAVVVYASGGKAETRFAQRAIERYDDARAALEAAVAAYESELASLN